MNESHFLSKGALLFRDEYSGERTKIVCTQWPEISKGSSYILASEEFEGNVLDAISFAIAFVKNHSTNGFRKLDTERVDYFAYPLRSVTEGIVNAVAHRNYFVSGSQIEINLFKDRLEITSPGALLGVKAMNKEKNISSIIPRRRNEVICSILEYCRYMESKGSGFDKIEQDYAGKADSFRPFVSSNASSFTLVLPNLTFETGIVDENSIPDVYAEGLVDVRNGLKILSFCFCASRTAKEIADYVQLQPSTYFRKNVLERLVSQGYLLKSLGESTRKYRSNSKKVFLS
ncbi:MAG: hypothetical protein KBS81_08475 [Spirochaetales bacterium]|nr:hypothetical protein [Candidatus Physcosoma equi]